MRLGELRQPVLTAAILGVGILLLHLAIEEVFPGPGDNPPSQSTNSTKSEPLDAAKQEAQEKRDRETFEKIADSAQRINDMVLVIIGASLAVLVGSTYLHPLASLRWVYLAFPVGWSFLGRAMYYGLLARGTFLAYLVNSKAATQTAWVIRLSGWMNQQVRFFKFGLCAFAVWLLLYVGWWITQAGKPKDPDHKEIWNAFE